MMLIQATPKVQSTGPVFSLASPILPVQPASTGGFWRLPPKRCRSAHAGVWSLHIDAVLAGSALCTSLQAARERQRRSSLRCVAPTQESTEQASKVRNQGEPGSQRPGSEQRLREVESLVSAEGDDGPEAALRGELPAPEPALVQTVGARYSDVRRELPRALPFLPEPGYRSFASNVPGDAGFDPLGLCTDVKTFVNYREAELKHGRLAMLAALAWPLAELAEERIVEENTGPDFLADAGGRLLPTLTGGLGDQFVESFVAVVLLVGAFFELNVTREEGAAPGDYNADPFGLSQFKPPSWARVLVPLRRPWTQEAEVKHGRIAMLAVIYDILDEVLTGNPVVEDTEYLFHRIDARLFRLEYWTFQPEVLDSVGIDSIS
mmetsp:Transcript_23175/g.65706  ORF Transcript_23175/g.65706 Transcript_23175/m.65706 type:complete len:378 (-) Transcript_23175:255-1388(-)